MFRVRRYLSSVVAIVAAAALLGCQATPEPSTSPVPAPSGPPQAAAPQANLVTESVTLPGQAGQIKAFVAKPAGPGPFPGLVVIHENRGLTDHIRDVARRFAAQGYAAIAPDMLSRVGGREQYATDDAAVAAIGTLSQEGVSQDLRSSFDYLGAQPDVKPERIGVIGYCWGGGNSLLMGTRVPELRTVVLYYGPNPADIDDVANISGPILGIYGAEDTRITVNVPALDEAMQKHGKSFEYKVYPGAAHAFFNDTGARYHEASAADAWTVTLAFLGKNLKG